MSFHSLISLIGYRIFLNGLLRVSTIASRLLLLLILLKATTPEVVGAYGVVSATVAYVSLLIGADFYQYAQRELIAFPPLRRSFVIQHQVIATSMFYTVLIPTSLLIFAFEILPKSLSGIFYVLTISEHLGQEVGRTLTAISRTLTSGIVLFLRSASWVWILAACYLFGKPSPLTLEYLLELWLVGSLVGLIAGTAVIYREIRPWRRWPLDIAWIWRGIRKSLLYFCATMVLKGITTVDRYMMQLTSEPNVIGAYVAYVGIAMVLINMLDAIVFAPLFPRLVETRANGQRDAFINHYRKLHQQTLGLAVMGSVLSVTLAPYVFQWAGKSVYLDHIGIYYVLVVGIFFYALGMVPHYALYAKSCDVSIFLTQLLAIIPFVVTFAITYNAVPTYGAALSLLSAFLFIFLAKTTLNRHHI